MPRSTVSDQMETRMCFHVDTAGCFSSRSPLLRDKHSTVMEEAGCLNIRLHSLWQRNNQGETVRPGHSDHVGQ